MYIQALPLILILAVAGCTKTCDSSRESMTPEQVVQTYLEISLNMEDPSEREKLLELTTGNLKHVIAEVPDEEIQRAFVDKNLFLESYSVVERDDKTPRETLITFSLVYRDIGKDREVPISEAAQVSTENTVAVVKEDDAWYIRDVIGKKTTIDFQVEKEIIKPEAN